MSRRHTHGSVQLSAPGCQPVERAGGGVAQAGSRLADSTRTQAPRAPEESGSRDVLQTEAGKAALSFIATYDEDKAAALATWDLFEPELIDTERAVKRYERRSGNT